MRISGCLLILLFVISFSGCKDRTVNNTKIIVERITGISHLKWSREAVVYEVNLRQYTNEGTIRAFERHLPRLKELGVDVLCFMPIFPISKYKRKGLLGSYYAVKDHKEINPEFGTSEDFKRLMDKAHNMGFKVLLDWVAAHTGCDNVWVTEHPDWYIKSENGDFVSAHNWEDTYMLDYDNQEMCAAMIEALEFWIHEYDVDGYRCNVAQEIPINFWENARGRLDAIKPVFMLAEAEHPELLANAFDMCYNWSLKDMINQISNCQLVNNYNQNNEHKCALHLDELLAYQDTVFPMDSYLMNHISGHNINSYEGTEFDRLGAGVKAFAVLTYTIPGMPLIYTGQETGLNHSFDFFDKDIAPDWTRNEWFDFYQRLNELRHTQPALSVGCTGGKLKRYLTKSPDLYIFSREKHHSKVLIYLNLSKNPVKIEYLNEEPQGKYRNFFMDDYEELPEELSPWEYKVFVF